jgi:cytochrome c5
MLSIKTFRFGLSIATGLTLLADAPMASADGEATYKTYCATCHKDGLAGAPKFGDAAAWKDRIAQGKEVLYKNALNGFQGKAGVMPPKGGFSNLSDDEVKAATDFMVAGSQ